MLSYGIDRFWMLLLSGLVYILSPCPIGERQKDLMEAQAIVEEGGGGGDVVGIAMVFPHVSQPGITRSSRRRGPRER